jgi:hypothetical protein
VLTTVSMAGTQSPSASGDAALGYHWRAFFAYKARRTIQPTKDGRNTKRAAQMTVLLRINERQHKTPAMTAMPRSSVPLRMTQNLTGAAGAVILNEGYGL